MASSWIRRGEYISIEDEMRKIDQITVEEVRDCAKRHPLRPEVVAFAIAPGEE